MKGVPQGSILGPLIFNIFINDIFYVLSGLYNYADDNTISRHGTDVTEVKYLLEEATCTALNWFDQNEMQANPDKFQALLLGHLVDDTNIFFDINVLKIFPSDTVKLLGIHIDQSLSFHKHASTI